MHKMTVGLELCQNPWLFYDEPYLSALWNAVASAKVNLQARHYATLEGPFFEKGLPYPYVVVTAPDSMRITPRHLRGISTALLNQYKEFNECRVGTRLFHYHILCNREDQIKPVPKHQYTTEELTDIWAAFEKELHMGPGYHLCAADVHHFLDFLKEKEKTNGTAV